MVRYTVRCKNDDSLIYVGSTIQPLFKRWFEHKQKINKEKSKEYHKLLYKKIRESNIEDWYIELYENISCENKEQLNKREGEIIIRMYTHTHTHTHTHTQTHTHKHTHTHTHSHTHKPP